MDEGDGESREGSRTSSVELSIDGLEGLADLATTPPAVLPLALRRSASSFRAFLHAAGAGGARMHLASFWDQFYETHPCVDAGFEWYASWNDVAAVLAGRQDEPQPGASPGHSRQQVLISGVGKYAVVSACRCLCVCLCCYLGACLITCCLRVHRRRRKLLRRAPACGVLLRAWRGFFALRA